MNVKFDENIPIYIQIMDLIKMDIINEKIKPGDKLLSVREMASELKVNPNTLQRAYGELERENIVYTQRGMGTFIIEDKCIVETLKNNMAKEIVEKFIVKMKNLGFSDNNIKDIINQEFKGE